VCHVHSVFFSIILVKCATDIIGWCYKTVLIVSFSLPILYVGLSANFFQFGEEMAQPISMKFGRLGCSSALQKIPHIPPCIA